MIIVIKGYLKGGKLLRIYDRIKREHLFVFLVLLSALIVFNSFDDQFGYTGLTVGVANNYVTGNSFIDTIGKYIKNPFTTKGAIPKVSCDYNGPDEVIIPLCSANPSCWWDSDSGLCRSTESTDVGAIPTEIPLSVILDKRSMLPGETVTLTASNNIGILTWEVLTTDTCRFEATGNRIISGINNARITSIVSGMCSVSVHDTRETDIGQVIKEINIRPQGSTVEAPTTIQSCNDKYNLGNKETLVNTQLACDADSICEWNGITNTCMEKGGLITITSDKTGILNIGDLAYLNARSQGVSSFRWIILNYNPQNPVCVIVHHGTEDGGPYVNYGIPLRAKNPGICQVSVRDDRSTDPITYVAVYTFSVQNLQQTSIEIVAPSNLQARLSNNNVILSWNLWDVINTVTTGAVYENQITGNAGFFDSIANFFRNLFGIGTRGALLTQQNLVYDVWRKEGSGAYNVLEQSVLCSVSRNTCTYTDTTLQQGKTYYYKVGVRASTEVFSSTSVKFSNEASIAISGTTQPACGSITDIYLCSDNDDRCTWDTTTNHCVDKTTEQPSGQPASAVCNTYPAAQCPADKCKPIGSGCTDKICSDYSSVTCPTDKCQREGDSCKEKPTTGSAAFTAEYGDLDFNQDGGVDVTISGSDTLGSDGVLFTQHFGTTTSSSNWDVRYDLNKDGKVDINDFFIIGDLLSQTPSPSEGVENVAPQASFTLSVETVGVQTEVTFDATGSSDTDGNIVLYKWNFGDGALDEKTTPTTKHSYAKTGNFEVTLTVVDDDSLQSYAKRTVHVIPTQGGTTKPLRVDFTVQQNAIVGEELVFEAFVRDPDIPGVIVATDNWDFGDGTTTTGNPVRYSYSAEGTYNVTLKATTQDKQGEVTKGVTVSKAGDRTLGGPTDLSLRYDATTNAIIAQWRDENNHVTTSLTVSGGKRTVNYGISRESDGIRNNEFGVVRSVDVCTDEICTYTDRVDLREGKTYTYRIRAERGELRSLFSSAAQMTISPACMVVGGEGCSNAASNGETEGSRGNSFCNSVKKGSVCVKCDTGFSWDSQSENCLSNNPKANGESCVYSNECSSRICSSENVCSEDFDMFDFNDDRCVDVLDVYFLSTKIGGSDLTYDLNGDGVVSFDDYFFLGESKGLGDACPIVKGDFNNNRCIENDDKAMLEEELAKPEVNRRMMFDANGDGGVNVNDLLYMRTHYREGGKCAPLESLPGDVNKDRCVDGRDILAFTDVMKSTGIGIIALNDQNGDMLLDGKDIQVIRSSFGGENCPDTVFTYGDFNGNGQVEITVGETTGELTGADGLLFKNHMGTTEAGGGNWDATYDLNADGKVDFDDFLVLADLFGVTEERTSFNSQAGSTVSLLSSKIRLSFSATETVNTDIRGRYLSFNPKSSNVGGKVGLNFVDLTSTQSLTGKVSQLVIKVGYDDQDVQDLGLVENSLRMYYFNDGTNDWELLT